RETGWQRVATRRRTRPPAGGAVTNPPHHHVVPERAARGRIALTRDELIAWGTDFGASARPPLVVAISGELGAGKTTLVQAICAGAGARGQPSAARRRAHRSGVRCR